MERHAEEPRPETILRPGDLAQIRSEAEILATLDATGRLDGMPFMPEMLQHCGETQRVFKRADKTCDSIWDPGLRSMNSAVFLWGLRCDGSAHGGCQAGCLFFWKEEWLRPAATEAGADRSAPPHEESEPATGGAPRITRGDLVAAARVESDPGTETFSCQATEVGSATTPLPEDALVGCSTVRSRRKVR